MFVLNSPEEVEAATVERVPLWVNLQHEHGPFDIIGDVHGCYDELAILLEHLGYKMETRAGADGETGFSATHPEGRKAVFVGDLVDRGPGVAKVLKLVMAMASDGVALCVAGNHESKLVRKLRGRNVQVSHGLAESLAQLGLESPAFRQRVAEFLYGLISHYVLDDGGLVVAHAGMKSEYPGPGLRAGPGFLPIWRDHRRDRRVRSPGAGQLGRRLPWPGDGGLRSYPGCGSRLAEQYH